jgi:hypothetical protein
MRAWRSAAWRWLFPLLSCGFSLPFLIAGLAALT